MGAYLEVCININYSSYSIEELIEAKDKIDKQKYPNNYESLHSELSSRTTDLEIKNQVALKEKQEETITQICSPFRVFCILVFGFIGSLYFALSSKFGQMEGVDKLLALFVMLMAGLPLLHSFLKGWTLGRHGVVTLTDDAFSYSIMQLFYSFVLFYIISSAFVWW